MLFDSHAHLDFVDDLEKALDRAKEAGVLKIVTIGTSIECSKKCIELAEQYSSDELQIYATCGIHPGDGRDDIIKYGDKLILELKNIAHSSKKVVAIGECGLDFHVGTSAQRPVTSEAEKEFQRKLFSDQIKLANDLDLPLVVHCRNAWDEIVRLLTMDDRQSTKLKGVFHSWTGDLKDMEKALYLNFLISFSGIVTFKNAPDIQEAAKKAPVDKILIETDSPFLTPEPLRGKKNSPENVKITASFLAKIRNKSLEDVSSTTTANAQKLFNLW